MDIFVGDTNFDSMKRNHKDTQSYMSKSFGIIDEYFCMNPSKTFCYIVWKYVYETNKYNYGFIKNNYIMK